MKRDLLAPPEELKRKFTGLVTAADVADLLEVKNAYLSQMLFKRAERYPYRTFLVPKSTGGSREIRAPHSSVAILQRKLLRVLELMYRPHHAAHGFIEDKSIVTNARVHAGKAFVLNIDLEDFFTTINFGRVRGMFMAKPYGVHAPAATVLAQLCCNNGTLPQGAPTSPIVSNMIGSRMDTQLKKLSREYRCTYTRYADDMTFSTTSRRFPAALAAFADRGGGKTVIGDSLRQLIESNGFKVNPAKVRLQAKGHRQEVTGLVVNRFPNVQRRYVRDLRALIHSVERTGLQSAAQRHFEHYDKRFAGLDPAKKEEWLKAVIGGRLEYIRMVKGHSDLTFQRLSTRIHASLPDHARRYDPAPSTVAASEFSLDWSYQFERYKDSVYMLEVKLDIGDLQQGTAFLHPRGVIVTAAHNLCGVVHMWMPDGTKVALPEAARHPRAPDVDLARAVMPPGGTYLPFVKRDEPLQSGEEVAAIGFAKVPLRDSQIGLYRGHVERKGVSLNGMVHTVQVSIPISGGLSGAPVIDRAGLLVGVVIESTFEQANENAAPRSFGHILPVEYLAGWDRS